MAAVQPGPWLLALMNNNNFAVVQLVFEEGYSVTGKTL
jgi:hypothetical protein